MSKKQQNTETIIDGDEVEQLDLLLEAVADEDIKYITKSISISLFPETFPGRYVSAEEVRVAAKIGIIQDIILEEDGHGGYVIRDGHRRIMMAHRAVAEYESKVCRKLQARIYPPDGARGYVQTLVLNNVRSNNPLKEFQAIKALEAEGYTIDQIAHGTGIPKATIKKRMGLAKLVKPLAKAWTEGKLTNPVAEAAAKLSLTYQKRLIGRLQDGAEKITARDLLEVRTERRQEAVTALPADMFQGVPTGTVESWAAVTRRIVQQTLQTIPAKAQDVREALEAALAALENYS